VKILHQEHHFQETDTELVSISEWGRWRGDGCGGECDKSAGHEEDDDDACFIVSYAVCTHMKISLFSGHLTDSKGIV